MGVGTSALSAATRVGGGGVPAGGWVCRSDGDGSEGGLFR